MINGGWDSVVPGGGSAVSETGPSVLGRQVLANAQTTEQVAQGIEMPLVATSQKLWDPRKPALSWAEFQELAKRTGSAG
ncbi:hypothetical protein SCALM49S_02275 [Streptomyces californicus]